MPNLPVRERADAKIGGVCGALARAWSVDPIIIRVAFVLLGFLTNGFIVAAYAASGEPLECAGAFTLEALGGWFIDAIEGDPSSVIGLSLPVLRRALYSFGLDVSSFWSR